jgi:DCN1-like protein 4/5
VHRVSSLPQLSIAVSDLENLLIRGGQPLKRTSSLTGTPLKKGGVEEPYNRTAYWTYVADQKKAFSKLYTFCFALAKPEYVLSRLSCYPADVIGLREQTG